MLTKVLNFLVIGKKFKRGAVQLLLLPLRNLRQVLRYEERLDFARRGRKRVAAVAALLRDDEGGIREPCRELRRKRLPEEWVLGKPVKEQECALGRRGRRHLPSPAVSPHLASVSRFSGDVR